MVFNSSPAGRAVARRAKNEHIFCVGWHAFVHWPARPGESPRPVPLTDAAGASVANDLADGQEVEILSWRPRAREGVSYQIRRLADGSEWWIAALHLRREAQVDPPSRSGPAPDSTGARTP